MLSSLFFDLPRQWKKSLKKKHSHASYNSRDARIKDKVGACDPCLLLWQPACARRWRARGALAHGRGQAWAEEEMCDARCARPESPTCGAGRHESATPTRAVARCGAHEVTGELGSSVPHLERPRVAHYWAARGRAMGRCYLSTPVFSRQMLHGQNTLVSYTDTLSLWHRLWLFFPLNFILFYFILSKNFLIFFLSSRRKYSYTHHIHVKTQTYIFDH